MSQPYHDLLQQLDDNPAPFRGLALEASFIGYLVLGQFVLLLLWWLLSAALRRFRRTPATTRRWSGAAFVLSLFATQVVLLLAWPRLASAVLTTNPILLADIVVTSHFLVVVFMLLALVLIFVGWPLGWTWTRNFWFRLTHLIVVEVIAGQGITGIECPFTTLERHLRGGLVRRLDGASEIGQFCIKALYYSSYDAEGQLRSEFLIVYLSVAVLVLLTWMLVLPRLPWDRQPARAGHPLTTEAAPMPQAAIGQ